MKIDTILASKGTNVITISPDVTLKQATLILGQHNIGALVVVDDRGAPIGILSERDIVREAARNDEFLRVPASAVMTRQVIAGSSQDDLRSVMQTMTDKHFRHLPIVDEGRLVGIVSIGDVVKAQIRQYQGMIDTLETRVNQG